MDLGFLESPEIVPNRPRPMGFVSRVTVSVCHSERALLLKLIFPMYPTIAKMSHFDDEKFKQLQLKVKFNVIPKTRLKKFGKLFDGYPTGLVKSEPGGFVMPPTYGENAEKIYRMKPRTDDVWLLTFPKCGTTWTSELLWLLENDCNFETAAKIQLHSRAPFLEMPYLSAVSGPMKNFLMTVDKVEKLPSPRVIRPHLPFYLLPPELLDTTKVVYVARNPKDVIVSYYFHHKLIKVHGYTGTVKDRKETRTVVHYLPKTLDVIANMSRFDEENFKKLQLNVNFDVIPKTRLKKFNQHFKGYTTGLVRSEPGKFVFFPLYANHADRLYRMQPRTDDVWLLTFPKCGTTWTSELLWLLMNNCDTEKATSTNLFLRASFIDGPFLSSELELSPLGNQMLNSVNKMASPRILKSHMPFYLLHPKLLDTSKVVYVARNPKDAIVSFYHHHKLMKFQDYQGTLEEFAQYFMDDEILYSPFFPHMLDAWSKRNHPNMHFMFFEDMKKDLRGEIVKVAAFLNQSPTDEQLDKITEHLRFDNFEKNESVNNEAGKKQGWMNPDGKFIRKGKTGDWKNHFSPELNSRIDEWIEKNLAGSDLKFVTELEHQD